MRKIYLALLLLVTGLFFTSNLYAQPSITYTTLVPSCAGSDVVLSGVSITDAVGVPTAGALMPRIYFKKNAGGWFSAAGTLTSGSGTSGTWDFTISAAAVGGLTSGATLSYFVIAENNSSAIAANPGAGLAATDVNTITTFPTTPNAYTVSPVPTIASLTTSTATSCVGSTFTLTAGTVSGTGALTSYNWVGPDSYSTTGTSNSVMITPATTVASGTYSLNVTYPGDGCVSALRTVSVTVNGALPAIGGTNSVCVGSTTALTNGTAGGVWSSSNTGVATINSSTGVASGIAAATATITYAVGSCVVTTVLTVNPLPFSITGSTGVCIGNTTTLDNAATGGTWASSNTSIATVGVGTGVVTGVSNGLVNITYTLATGCRRTTIATVYPFPSAIGGSLAVCEGLTTNLSSSPTGGTWATSDGTVATISSTGSVTGVIAGTATMTYTLPTGCIRTAEVTVNPLPAAIAGPSSVCSGSTITLTSATGGGAWSSGSPATATINFSSGLVTGVSSGLANMTYTLGTGCKVTYPVTGYITPNTITGTTTLCEGTTTTLSDMTSGGTWSSSDGAVANIGVSTGFVTAVAFGTSNITYTLSTGCFRSTTMTVNPIPAPITGTAVICAGSTTTFSNTTPGGTWVSGTTSRASVNISTGLVTGIAAGTSNITYRLSTGCQVIQTVTVNALPANITGTAVVCEGAITSLSNTSLGGAWTSSNIAVGTISAGGILTGISAGTTDITYTLPTGCIKTKAATVNPVPAPIGGLASICPSGTSVLTSATTGGTWSSSATSIATVGVSTGILTGVGVGNANITYRLPTTCIATVEATVNPFPAAITGTPTVCLGSTTALSNADAGGAWSSSNALVASVSGTGIVTGVALGTARISYTLPTGCYKTLVVTVNAVPTAIAGTFVVCEASTTDLTSTPGSGTWTSSNTSIATVGIASGAVTGVAAGTATITYTIGTGGCNVTAEVTVNPRPVSIAGALAVCIGANTTLSNATVGGVWSSSNLTVATIDGAGVATGVLAGVSTISYTLPTGCARTAVATVNALPALISGASVVCEGFNTSLTSSSYVTGTWSSSDVTIATVGATGVVTGVMAGTANLSFIFPTGCYRTMVMTVNQSPAAISGTPTVCSGNTTTLSNSVPGGVWTAAASAIVVVDATTGVVTGISSGVAPVTYSLGTGCRATILVTTYITPPPIVGPTTVCVGSTMTLANSQPGGAWSSSDITKATISSGPGLVTGIANGTVDITYTSAAGCMNSTTITVNSVPAAIAGVGNVCVGGTTMLSNPTPGGSWYTSAAGIAGVGAATGIVTGVSAGTATISYKLLSGCLTSTVVTVDALPGAITGTPSICLGLTTTLTSTSAGGAWNTSDPTVATVDAAGIVTGISTGTAVITYTIATGCFATKNVTVNPLPLPIGGVTTICEGSTSGLTNATVGGTWSSSNTSIATVNAFGLVAGINAGVATITYRLNTSCISTADVTINAVPAPITGTALACVGSTSALGNIDAGGTWTSNSLFVASVDASGLVTANNVGTATISYTFSTGCKATKVFTVQALPSAITPGTPVLCEGQTSVLTSIPSGGVWASNTPLVAIVSSGGVLTGIAAGTSVISYSLSTGCTRTITVTVNQLPPVSTGTTTLCIGTTTTLSNALPGGLWSSSTPIVASVDMTTGIVMGNAAGSANISYTMPSGCKTVTNVLVRSLPAVIGGIPVVCVGQSAVLTEATPGGTWSSNNTAIATVGSGSGIVVGVAAGTTDVTYTVITTGCYRTRAVTVNAVPSPITGSSFVCVGSTTTLSNATLGGTWSSSATSIATIGATSGILTGIANGTANITYKMSTGCFVTTTITVNFLPGTIGGTGTACVGASTVYTSLTPGGVWSTSNSLIATIAPATGVITGVSNGTAIITYTLGTGCIATRVVSVFPMPSPIAGSAAICQGSNTHLSSLSPGGTWSSSNTFVATVGLSNGLVNGISGGIATITYTLGTGCSAMVDVTVNAAPTAIMGIANVCIGSTSALSSLTPGGSWSSSNTLVATISPTGVVTGVGLGTSAITYLMPTGCQATLNVTVSALPASILGVPTVCVGSTTTLTNTTAGGTWSSSDVTIASISSTGVVTGINDGIISISYTMPSGCAREISFTVNPVPTDISGMTTLCLGQSTTLSSSTPGGVWTSSNTSVASIGVSTGLLTGVAPGTSIITYALSTSCRLFAIATVYPLPTAITGNTSVCEGSTTTLSNGVSGGIWSSDFLYIATVDASTGVVTGTGPGRDTIRYTLGGGCSTLIIVTVTPAPPGIIGNTNLCVGQTSILTNDIVGGSWSSSNPSVATIGLGSGLVTALSTGIVNITYTLGAGCRVITTATVNAAPSPITGPSQVCMGQTVTLFNAVSGGTWSSSSLSVAPIDNVTGVVTGVAANTVTISYALPGGCYVTFGMTVNSTPPANDGADSVCRGLTTTLTNLVPGGIWVSSDPSIAPVGLSTGVVLGVAPGTATISYTLLGTGCYRTSTVTVNPLPEAITGVTNICVGALTTLSTTSVGGSWSSSDLGVAVVGAGTGLVTGLDDGVATITYTLPTGCIATALVVVNPIPDAIAGVTEICVGSSTTLTDATPFGTWSSSFSSVASIGSSTGIVTGLAAGTTTISYTLLTTGCYVTQQININPLPPSISGNVNICLGTTTFLTNLASGGTWSSSNTAVATIDVFGNVTSSSVGTTTITYTLGTACYVTRVLHVEPNLNPITGTTNVCEFADITFTNDFVGGVWTSDNTSIATVSSAGVVTGVLAGNTIITYATPLAGCYATRAVTVDPVPVAIAGTAEVCEGLTTTLSDATAGGTWSSSDISIATISGTGTVTGLAANTVLISYTIGTGCTTTVEFTVNPQPNAGTISGPAEVCLQSSITLVSTVADGTWTSNDTSIVKIDLVSGVALGNGVGTGIITYTYTNMCGSATATFNVLVKPLPDAGVLSGNTGLCINYSSTLTSTVSGGVWTSSNPSVATIGAATGIVTGLVAGTTTITYNMTTDCGTDLATLTVTVHVMAPHTNIAIHPDSVLCLNSQFRNFGVDSAAPTGISYTWTAFNAEVYATSADKQNAIISFWNEGPAVVRVMTQYTGTGCFVMDSFAIRVKPDAAFTPEVQYFAKELICSDNLSDSYQWGYDDAVTLDSNIIKGEDQQSFYLPNPDFVGKRYWVIAERGGCFQKVYYEAPTGVQPNLTGGISVKLFPNPADSRVNIEVTGISASEEITIRLIDMLGKEVETSALVSGKGSINVSNLPAGIYSVMFINNGAKVASKTFVKN